MSYQTPGIHIQLTHEDKPYFPILKSLLIGRCKASINYDPVVTSLDGIMKSQKNEHKTKLVISTSDKLLQLITGKSDSSIDNFSGSVLDHLGYEHLFLPPLKQLATVPYGKFLFKRYLNKFLTPDAWLKLPKFSWQLFHPRDKDELYRILSRATFAAVDIENDYPSENRCITCVGITAVNIDTHNKSYTATTFVIPFIDEYHIEVIRQFMSTTTPKVFQNGKFDNAYFLRFGIPVRNYFGDTINLFHSWYSELPKSLDTITSFCLRKWSYWKDEAQYGIGSMEYYGYNAKDAFTTAMDFLVLLMEIPEFAIRNYLMEFPVVFPCILSEMTGIKIDHLRKEQLADEVKKKNEKNLVQLRAMVSNPRYNPNSPQQTQRLWIALGSGDVEGTGKVQADKVASRHPLNRRIVNAITRYREFSGALSKYIDKDFVWHGRCFYTLNPHGTDTGRLASRESAFNTGLQIQNIKRDSEEVKVKDIFISDEGFYLGEADYKQNETWYQAFTSGDENLIKAITDTSKDFHKTNASSYFGVRYEEVDKPLRQLSKPIGHGASYNMTASVLLDTMGIDNVLRARRLLDLNKSWTLIQICQYLLDRFDITYPVVRGLAYDNIRNEIKNTGMLVGPSGWTRICFSDPIKSKRGMNMYAAHKSQSPAAIALNKSYVKVFSDVWMKEENRNDFKLLAQIHDSILFQYRIGRDDIPHLVAKAMSNVNKVTDIFGIEHEFIVPVDLKIGSNRWSELKEI